MDESVISKFDVENISVKALLFQTGYLTITSEEQKGHRTVYQLDYPNLKVKLSRNDELLTYLNPTNCVLSEEGKTLRTLLEANDFEGFAQTLKAYLPSIPYQWHNNDLARYEAGYARLLDMTFRTIGVDVDVRSEEALSRGQTDIVVLTDGQVFIIEFKMAETADKTEAALEAAFAQIKDRGYTEKYQDRKEPIHLVGIACGRDTRNLLDIRVDPAVAL